MAGCLPREVRRPSQNVAPGTLAESMAAQHQAFTDFQRLRFQSQLEVALHILAEGFQRSGFLLKHGVLDAVVPRLELKPYLSKALRFFSA